MEPVRRDRLSLLANAVIPVSSVSVGFSISLVHLLQWLKSDKSCRESVFICTHSPADDFSLWVKEFCTTSGCLFMPLLCSSRALRDAGGSQTDQPQLHRQVKPWLTTLSLQGFFLCLFFFFNWGHWILLSSSDEVCISLKFYAYFAFCAYVYFLRKQYIVFAKCCLHSSEYFDVKWQKPNSHRRKHLKEM